MKYPPPPHNSPFGAFYSATQAFNSASEGNNSESGAFCSEGGAKSLREDAFYSVAAAIYSVTGGKNWEGGSMRWVMDLTGRSIEKGNILRGGAEKYRKSISPNKRKRTRKIYSGGQQV